MLQETARDGLLLPKSVLMKDAPDEGHGRSSCRLVKVGVREISPLACTPKESRPEQFEQRAS